MWYVNVEQYLVWYYIFIAIVLLITGIATMIHKKVIPFMWGIILSLVLLIGVSYIEPILFGFLSYYQVNWYAFALFGSFTVVWFGYVALCLYNSVRYGGVVE